MGHFWVNFISLCKKILSHLEGHILVVNKNYRLALKVYIELVFTSLQMEKFPSLFCRCTSWNIFCQKASIIVFNMLSDFEELHYKTHITNKP